MNFKEVPGIQGLTVSECGEVRLNDKVKKQHTSPAGYKTIHYKGRNYLVHRLVLMAFRFVDNHADLHVNHINGIRHDNNLNNVQWCTRLQNSRLPKRMNKGRGQLYKNIYPWKQGVYRRWRVMFRVSGKLITFKYFNSQVEAIEYRNIVHDWLFNTSYKSTSTSVEKNLLSSV